MNDLSALTMDELQARFVASAAEYVALANERQAISEEIEARKKRAAAQARVSSMTEAEKAALLSALGGSA